VSNDDTYRRQIVPYQSMSTGKQLKFLCDYCHKDKTTTGRKRIRKMFWYCSECQLSAALAALDKPVKPPTE